jgi:S1-C subfamily serine protease
MRYLNAKLILMFVALILSPGGVFALPTCKWSGTEMSTLLTWHNCYGELTRTGFTYKGEFQNNKFNGQGTLISGYGKNRVIIVGEWKNSKVHGKATFTYSNGEKVSGVFSNGIKVSGVLKENSPSNIEKTKKKSLLNKAFYNLSTEQREKVQSNLAELGLYKSSIDGLYGKGTAAALEAYNDQNQNGADLTKSGNVSKLLTIVLGLNPMPAPKPKGIQSDQRNKTYKVASGTGFYVSSQGHIITNHHVIDGCKDMKAHSKGRMLATLQIAIDKQNDLALLKAEEAPSHVFALSNDSPYPLQEVIVAGFPFGDKYSSSLKFTQGIVSSLTGMGNNYSEIQIDAALQQGNSGGPIIDEYGSVIAVAVAKLDAKYMFDNFGIIPENTNFGVKVSAVRNLMEGSGVSFKLPDTEVPSRQDLSRQATDGTVFLTCWMTMAQVEKLRSNKVMFEDLE